MNFLPRFQQMIKHLEEQGMFINHVLVKARQDVLEFPDGHKEQQIQYNEMDTIIHELYLDGLF